MDISAYIRTTDFFYNVMWTLGALGFFALFIYTLRKYNNISLVKRYTLPLTVIVFLFVSIVSLTNRNSRVLVETQAETAAPKNVVIDTTSDPGLIYISWETDNETDEYLFYRVSGYDTLIIASPVKELGISREHKISIPKRPVTSTYIFEIHYGGKVFTESQGKKFEFTVTE